MNRNEYNITMWTRLFILFALSFFFYQVADAKTITVAVIDTGFDFKGSWTTVKPKLCKYGHKDFTGTGLTDNHGHGTHVAGLIAKGNEKVDYCLVILKYWNDRGDANTINTSTNALRHAIDIGVTMINYSGGGVQVSEEEQRLILKALNKGITIVVAAGNERNDKPYYPAAYDKRIIVVGSKDQYGNRLPSSSYGPNVDFYELGKDIYSTLPNNQYGYMTGTSQAAAITTGKILNLTLKLRSTK